MISSRSGIADPVRFDQFDLARSGQLSSYDLQRLLAKDSLMEDPREDAVKMVRSPSLRRDTCHLMRKLADDIAHEYVALPSNLTDLLVFPQSSTCPLILPSPTP